MKIKIELSTTTEGFVWIVAEMEDVARGMKQSEKWMTTKEHAIKAINGWIIECDERFINGSL